MSVRTCAGLLLCVSLAGNAGCRSDALVPITADNANLFWRLDLNRPAILMSTSAPYDTVRLVATPVNVYGQPLPLTAPVVFSKSDPDDASVTLSDDGLITANAEESNIIVYASVTMGGIKRTARAMVTVSSAPVRKIRNVSVQVIAPDSNTRWSNIAATRGIKNHAYYDDTGEEVSADGWVRFFLSRTPGVFAFGECDQGTDGTGTPCADASYSKLGDAWIILRAYAYGDDFVDSVQLHRIEPKLKVANFTKVTPKTGSPYLIVQPAQLTIAVGGTVSWGNPMRDSVTFSIDTVMNNVHYHQGIAGDSVDIVFDDSSHVAPGTTFASVITNAVIWGGSSGTYLQQPGGFAITAGLESDPTHLGGNIPAWGSLRFKPVANAACNFFNLCWTTSGYRTRSFPTAGTYHYHSTRYPTVQGTIVVQ